MMCDWLSVGIRGAYLVYPLSPTLVQATAIFAQAAKEAEVEIVANMSQWNSRPSAKSPATINQWLSEQVFDWSPVPVAHLGATFFCEWLLWVARAMRQGVMMMPWDANSPVAVEDLAQVIVAILENPVAHSGKTYPLCGPAVHSFAEVAEIDPESLSAAPRISASRARGHSYALIFVSAFFRNRASLGCELVAIRSQLTFYRLCQKWGQVHTEPSRLVSVPVVGGLHHRYIRVAA